jgi:hypothetical protein
LENILPPQYLAQKEEAARLGIALDIIDNIADVGIATSRYAAVDYVFLVVSRIHFQYF